VMTNGEVDGQLLKRLEFNYLYKCFTSDATNADLVRDMQKLRVDVPCDLIRTNAVIAGDEPSFFELKGNLVFSCCKPTLEREANTLILRLVNYSDKTEKSEIIFDRKIKSAHICRLDETVTGDAVYSGKTLTAEAGKWAYVTLKVSF
ncbi:MAG: hypothetical protein J6R00_00450, partial [Lentisphaeria bacterium]|nr:hypothetical protein [Lentisphaeria bacterium]